MEAALPCVVAVSNGICIRYRVADGAVVGPAASAVSRASKVATCPGGLVAGDKREVGIVAVGVGCAQAANRHVARAPKVMTRTEVRPLSAKRAVGTVRTADRGDMAAAV